MRDSSKTIDAEQDGPGDGAVESDHLPLSSGCSKCGFCPHLCSLGKIPVYMSCGSGGP